MFYTFDIPFVIGFVEGFMNAVGEPVVLPSGSGLLITIVFSIWYVVDIILVATRKLQPKNGRYL